MLHNLQYSYVTLCQPINLLCSEHTARTSAVSATHTKHTHTHRAHTTQHTRNSYQIAPFVVCLPRDIESVVLCVTVVLIVLVVAVVAIVLVSCALAALVRCAMSRGANFREFYRLTLSNLINLSQLTKNHKNLCKSKGELFHRRCNAYSSQ